MTPEQINLVKASFSKIAPISATAAEIFYAKLFELDPSLKPLFKGDMTKQGAKLMSMIGSAVSMLNKLDELVPIVKNLAIRHLDYGVEAAHYDTVGVALLSTLETGLGEDFTPEVKEAWTETYTLLAGTMIEAAYGQTA